MREVGVMESICLNRRRGRIRCRVLRDNLFERIRQNLPGEDFDILLDVARLGVREGHDQLEEFCRFGLALGHCNRTEALEVTTDSVLFLDREPDRDQGLKEVDAIDGCQEAVVLLGPIDARDHNTIGLSVCRRNRCKCAMDVVPILATPELDQTTVGLPLFTGPINGHVVHVALELEIGLIQERGIGVVSAQRKTSRTSSSAHTGCARVRLRHIGRRGDGLRVVMVLLVVVIVTALDIVVVVVGRRGQGIA